MVKYLIGSAVVLVYLLAPQPDPLIFEDEPGWNCATMGNLTCGFDTKQ